MWCTSVIWYGTTTKQQNKWRKSSNHGNDGLACHSQGKRKGLSLTNLRKRFIAIYKKSNIVSTNIVESKQGILSGIGLGKTFNFNSILVVNEHVHV